jgi:peptidoglycan/LPS O-acetylase OafA/YrhL
VKARTRFPLVDSLRALAALGVLATHAAAPAGLYGGESGLGRFAARLDVGVALFFLISGFLLYLPFARARVEGRTQPHTGAYAWRRFLRIAPAYWVALTVIALVLSLPGVFTGSGIPTYYGLAQAYQVDTIGGGMAQAWSLTIEIAFYAFLPLFAFGMSRLPGATRAVRLRSEFIAVGALIAIGIAYKLAVLSQADPDAVRITPALLALPAYLDQFGLGMLLAVVTIAVAGRERLPSPLALVERRPWIPWAVAAVAFWASATQLGIDTSFFSGVDRHQYFLRHVLYAVVGFGMLLPAVVGDGHRDPVRRLLANPVLVYLGLISYGIFLYNLLVVVKLDDWGFGKNLPVYAYPWWIAAVLAVTVVIASISWYGLERPLLRLKNRVPGSGPRPRTELGGSRPLPESGAPPRQSG